MNNFYIISETANYLSEKFKDAVFTDIYTQEKNKLIIEVTSAVNEIKLLEFSAEKSFNYLIEKNNFSKASKNYFNLFEEINGLKITDISLHKNDRIILFTIENNFNLYFTFFSSKPNCYLVNDNLVLNSFKNSNIVKGLDINDVFEKDDKNKSMGKKILTVYDLIRRDYRKYGKEIVNEVINSLNIDFDTQLTDEIYEKIKIEFASVNDKLHHPGFYLYKVEDNYLMSLINLNSKGLTLAGKYENINQLLTAYLKKEIREEKTENIKSRLLQKHYNTLKLIIRKITNLENQIKEAEHSEDLKRKGDLILTNLNQLSKGMSDVELNDLVGNKTLIKLKPDLTPAENANRYFEKFKNVKSSIPLLKKKLENALKEKQNTEIEISKLENTDNLKTLIKEDKKKSLEAKDATSKFRKFILNDKYQVWVGKDSKSNDLLTTRHTLPDELWFHVRGAGGSHTVLKGRHRGEEVPKEMLIKAASIAAYYSKSRKASNVPVAFCEKKFVKKKKGFKPGTVLMEKEKVVFVKPSLP